MMNADLWTNLMISTVLIVMLAVGSILAISPRTYRNLFARYPLQQRYFDKGSPRDYRILGTLISAFALWMIVLLARDHMRN